MKKLQIILAIVLILCLFCACGQQESDKQADDNVTKYLLTAQSLIDEGNYEKAIAALNEGILLTGSEELKQMLASVQTAIESSTTSAATEIMTEPPTQPTTQPPAPTKPPVDIGNNFPARGERICYSNEANAELIIEHTNDDRLLFSLDYRMGGYTAYFTDLEGYASGNTAVVYFDDIIEGADGELFVDMVNGDYVEIEICNNYSESLHFYMFY